MRGKKTGGRTKGVRNKRTIADAFSATRAKYPDALIFLAGMMTSKKPNITPDLKLRAAIGLAVYQHPRPTSKATSKPIDLAPPKDAGEARAAIAGLVSRMARGEVDRDLALDVIGGLKAFLDSKVAELEMQVKALLA